MKEKLTRFVTMMICFLAIRQVAFAEPVEETVRRRFPEAKIVTVQPSPIPALFEVLTSEGQIFYYDRAGGYRVLGEIVGPDGTNLTAAKRERMIQDRLEGALEKAIKIGDGPNRVIEFIDPDCEFCRKTAEFFETRADVTRYVFFSPVRARHPDAERKSLYILCAPDKVSAYEEALSGRLDRREVYPCAHASEPERARLLQTASETLLEHQRLASSLGMIGTPLLFVNGKRVEGANIRLINKLLKGKE